LLKKAGELIRGRLQHSESYYSDYAKYTYEEILKLAKQGDPKAKGMKKLIEQAVRLMEKCRGKPR
jgi:hypothetical protein